MFDGIKIQDVSVDANTLLTNDRLTFAALVDGQTGVILDPTRRAFHRGLTVRLVPRRIGQGYRVEVKGSLHKFHNNGQHNADQFTVNDLLVTLDELVRGFGFDPFKSKLNNLEFGVNIELPFAVSQVLKNLVCYKNEPFYLDTHSDIPYYVCQFQQYSVKVYDKSKQRGLNTNLLRVEVRVRKMVYFNDTGIKINTLADLLNVTNYRLLGALLVDTFNEIVFDDSTIKPAKLPPDKQELYRNGRNPRYWQIPDDLTPKQANTYRQRLSRNRRRYRALFEQYGGTWQKEVASLISQTWNQLTTVDSLQLTRFNEYVTQWQNLIKPHTFPQLSGATCHELTDVTTSSMSRINPLYSELENDNTNTGLCVSKQPKRQQKECAIVCPVTGIEIENPRPRQRFVSATQLKKLYTTDQPTFTTLAAQFSTNKQGATLEQQCYYMAHNIRNAYANPFNNPLRSINNYHRSNQLQLFPISQTIKLTDRIQAGIKYRKGTRYEIGF